jgi:hypothetical protein
MIIIDQRIQRKGIGSDFLADLLFRARREQRSVALRVLKVNPARTLYQRLGFVVVGEDAETILRDWVLREKSPSNSSSSGLKLVANLPKQVLAQIK